MAAPTRFHISVTGPLDRQPEALKALRDLAAIAGVTVTSWLHAEDA